MLPCKFNLLESIEQITGIMLAEIKYKNLDFKINISENIPTLVVGDQLKFERILLNLLSNAIKFTNQGSIGVTGKIISQTKEKITLQITVKDTGIGIPEDKYETIFEHFSRLTPAHSNNYHGYGIGLYMVKQYVTEMGGDISVTSQIGKGSNFTYSLPFQLHAETLFPDEAINNIKTINFESIKNNLTSAKYILLIEDDAIAQKMSKYMLEEYFSCSVEVAANSQQALEMIAKNRYELILMDIGLPDIDGFTLVKKIRATNSFYAQIPIFGLTAHIDDDSLSNEQLSYFNSLLSKPLSEEICSKILSTEVI